MAKMIKYRFLSCEINHSTEESPNIEQIFANVTMDWNEANETIAQREAHNGEYEIIDDGQEEPEQITPEQRIAELEAALEMLLSGVTE